jgi:hydrogenase expression/formation protein HypC
MAIPSRVTAIDGEMATVECFGVSRSVSLMLMTEEVALGDLLIIQAGGFAVEKVDPQVGAEALEYLSTILQASEPAA